MFAPGSTQPNVAKVRFLPVFDVVATVLRRLLGGMSAIYVL
jgi:hypothetical protein